MIIRTQYTPGNKVWLVIERQVAARLQYAPCPKQLEIQCVRAHQNKNQANPTIEYYIQDDPHPESACFRCQEEAEAAAKKWTYDEKVKAKNERKENEKDN